MRPGPFPIVGPTKDLISSGGQNICPKEFELALDTLPEVTESAVIGVPSLARNAVDKVQVPALWASYASPFSADGSG